jgi:hypothetical protein
VNPKLKRIVEEIRAFQANPEPGDFIDGSLLLQFELVKSGESYTEDDLFEALDALGVPEQEQASWFERYASWI